jgi:Fe-S-cluster-containing hydrogenase component 2
MPKREEQRKSSDVDIFHLLEKTAEKEKKKRRQELLAPLDLTEYFAEGKISINKRTCRGVECRLCLKACPTNALFWKSGEVGITPELCIYCGACVLSCIVDECIKIERKRPDGKMEVFNKPQDFLALLNKIGSQKRFKRIEEVMDLLPKPEDSVNKRKSKTK